jgi:hypothetical protein
MLHFAYPRPYLVPDRDSQGCRSKGKNRARNRREAGARPEVKNALTAAQCGEHSGQHRDHPEFATQAPGSESTYPAPLLGVDRCHFFGGKARDDAIGEAYLHGGVAAIQGCHLANDRLLRVGQNRVGVDDAPFLVHEIDDIAEHAAQHFFNLGSVSTFDFCRVIACMG